MEEIIIKSFHSNLFGKIPKPETINELLDLFGNKKGKRDVRMWRGQGKISWPIHSSAYRRVAKKKDNVTDDNVVSYEKTLLEQATHKGFRYKNGRRLSDLEMLSKLQHYGAATRLIDFSRNAFVGLWFCCSNFKKSTGLLIGIHTNFLYGHEGKLNKRTYDEMVDRLKEINGPATWEPSIDSKRISSQHSQFLYSEIINSDIGSLKLNENKKRKDLFIAISPELKTKILHYLKSVFDIWEYTIFPDLDGFCSANNWNSDRYDMHRW